MATEDFFQETREQSVVKATIVEQYFETWANIIINTQKRQPGRPGNDRVGYIDLFAGPGRYKDGAESTPLRVLRKAIEKPDFADRLVTVFNDRDEANVQAVQALLQTDTPGEPFDDLAIMNGSAAPAAEVGRPDPRAEPGLAAGGAAHLVLPELGEQVSRGGLA